MARRGRPPHPDILTPREWEVLALLREGLSNQQIAERLGITERTAKFHVAEILGKLGVGSRDEAAAWSAIDGGQRQPWWYAAAMPLAFVWRKTADGLNAVGLAIGALLVLAALGGVALLAVMLLRDDGEPASVAVPVTVVPRQFLGFSFQGSIYTVDIDGANLRRVLDGDSGPSYTAPEFSPDGRRVAYIVDRRRVVVATADFAQTLSDTDLLFADPTAHDSWIGPTAVHWSPDGTMLLVTRQRLRGSGASDVVVMNADGSDQPNVRALELALQTSFFIEATWSQFDQAPRQPGDLLPPPRVVVVAGDDGLSGLVYDLEGNLLGPALPTTAPRYAVASLAAPRGEGALVRSTLGSPEPFGLIERYDVAGSQVTAFGCGATWSLDGGAIAHYDGTGIRVVSTSMGRPAGPIVTNGQLGLPPSAQPRTDVCGNLGEDAVSISWSATAREYRDDDLGFELIYPTEWRAAAAPGPYASCFECAVFGPRNAAAWPYGVEVFAEDSASPECIDGESWRCPVAPRAGNNAQQQGDERTLLIAGKGARQADILRNVPLGIANETGETTPYHEVWTAVPLGSRALILVAFYRDGDDAAKERTLAAYEQVLGSLRVEGTEPEATP